MSEQLELTWETGTRSVPILHLRGRLDAAGAQQLHAAALASLRDNNEPNLVVDLAEVGFVASTGLATFLLLHEEFVEAKGIIVFVNAIPAVMQVISLLNIDQFLRLESSADAAFDLIGV